MINTPQFLRKDFRHGLPARMRAIHRRIAFGRALRRFMRNPSPRASGFDRTLLSTLVYGWGNSWSAQHEYLETCLRHVAAANGPILECGSGLSTILMGILAQSTGAKIWSLEHNPKYAAQVQHHLDKHGVRSVNLCVAPLKTYGDFDWYSPPLETMPDGFSLVICDGPPGETRGGRYGMVPVMRAKLRPDCTILLDDGARPLEQSIADRWASALSGAHEIIGSEKPFIRLTVGAASPLPVV